MFKKEHLYELIFLRIDDIRVRPGLKKRRRLIYNIIYLPFGGNKAIFPENN